MTQEFDKPIPGASNLDRPGPARHVHAYRVVTADPSKRQLVLACDCGSVQVRLATRSAWNDGKFEFDPATGDGPWL